MSYQGTNYGFKNMTEEEKLDYNMRYMNELFYLYNLICKLVKVAYKNKFKLIIENPYNSQHFLTRYWCIKPKLIHQNRRDYGDHFVKPTQYWFINCEPKENFIFEGISLPKKRTVDSTKRGIQRSLISPYYANRFIMEYILDKEDLKDE